ncbi:glycoside hydrolase superfamily [Lenzites betulinus]|nr:glycoside hydrolase superfamily [Lenzites betulinus]
MSPLWLASIVSALSLSALQVHAFDNSRSDNLAVYWGQNSYGATHTNDVANWQHSIGYYCQDDGIDALPIAFLNVFSSTGGEPAINIANICSPDGNGVFPGTSLAQCQFLASDIEYCQSRGKIVTISLGGATGAASFSSAAQATAFGDTIWNLFLGGTSSMRPFGDAVLDGIDLDIEGGSTAYFDSFVNRIRQLASGASKRYYVTAAPQCPYPDAYLGTVLNQASFDAVYVQFYNNWCGLQNYNNIYAWDYSSWDTWAKTVSVNPNVKVYIGAPASSTAAGAGYVDATTLVNIALATRSQYSSFGGVMLWDASQAYGNNRYDLQIKNALRLQLVYTDLERPYVDFAQLYHVAQLQYDFAELDLYLEVVVQYHTVFHRVSVLHHASVLDYISHNQHFAYLYFFDSDVSHEHPDTDVAYVGGNQVSYNGHLWTAKWWSYNDVPGGLAGVWTDNGAC